MAMAAVGMAMGNRYKIYREAYLVAGAYPHESIYMLQHLFNNWFVNLDLDKMAAAAVVCGAVFAFQTSDNPASASRKYSLRPRPEPAADTLPVPPDPLRSR